MRGDLSDLDQTIDRMITEDPLASARARYREDYLGPFPADRYASAFVDAVCAILESPSAGARVVRLRGHRGPLRGRDRRRAPDGELDTDQEPDDRDGRTENGARLSGYYKQLLTKRRRLHQASVILALLALVAAILGVPAPVTMVLGIASLAAIFRSVRKILQSPRRWSRLLGESRSTRLLLIGAAALANATLLGQPVTATIVVVLLTCAVVGETHVQKAWSALGLVVRNFPEAKTELREVVPRGALPAASFLVISVALLVVPLSISPWILLAAQRRRVRVVRRPSSAERCNARPGW